MKKFILVGVILFVFFIVIYTYINISQISNNIAVLDFNNGKYKDALIKFNRAAIFKNESDVIKYNAANTSTKMYDYETAKNMYLDLLKEKNISKEIEAEIYFSLGNIECMYENFSEALKYYYIALTLNPQDEDIKHNIELVDYLNRPIIYNNEILTLPKQKLSQQISLFDKENLFKDKILSYLQIDITSIYDEYTKSKDDEIIMHKSLYEINVNKKLSIQKALIIFNDSYNKYLKNLSVNDDSELQKKLNKIKEKNNKNNKVIESYEKLKQRIIKEVNTKEKLAKMLSGVQYKNGLKDVIALEEYNPLSEENSEKSIDVVTRECLSLLNKAQYYYFIEQNFDILNELGRMSKEIISNSSADDMPSTKKQLLQIINLIVQLYSQNMLYNNSLFNEYSSMAQYYDNEICKELRNSSFTGFIIELKENKKYNLSYEKIMFYYKELYEYNMRISNIHLLFNNLIERDLYNINCIEYTHNILEQSNIMVSKDIMEIYEFLNVVLSVFPQYITQMKNQKQLYEMIERNNNISMDTILNMLSSKFYFNSISFKNGDFESIKKRLLDFLSSFESKEKEAHTIKNNINKISKEVKELENEIISVEENKHMYTNVKLALKTLEDRKNIKEDIMNKEEINLVKNIKYFIEESISKLSKQIILFEKSIGYTEGLLKNVIEIDDFKQLIAKERFLIGTKDLETELNNFEENKKYLLNSNFQKMMDNLYDKDNLISKSIYQKQKLDNLLIENRKINEQIEELKSQSENLIAKEKQELDMLQKKLLENQLDLVKYYVTIEDDDTKKSMTRQLMSSLYKDQYKAEENDNIKNMDLENLEYLDFRTSILILYKMYVFQLRELNKLIFRMKVMNSILDLEAISKLNNRIEFDKKYFNSKNSIALQKELSDLKQRKVQKNKQDIKELITIFKENMSSAKILQNKLAEYQKKQQKINEEYNKRQKQNLLNKMDVLDNKIEFLQEHIKYDDEQLNTKEDIDKMKEELESAKKERNLVSKEMNKLLKNRENESLKMEDIMESLIRSSDVVLKQVNEKEVLGKSGDFTMILYQQSNKDINNNDKSSPQVEIKNDW